MMRRRLMMGRSVSEDPSMAPLKQNRLAAHAWLLGCALLIWALTARAADYPAPVEGDFILRDFHFSNGETLPELRIHYRTLGTPQKDANGVVRNAVLIGHGTGGT